ncbi:MAG TPA: hypothetical protein VFU85_11990, partial [Nocardioides sp.]|nr:hypothetical protein [Nocardioides sp.]
IPPAATHEQPAVAGPTAGPAWAHAAHEGDGAASGRPVPVAGVSPVPPLAPVAPAAAETAKKTWRSRVSSGRGLAVGALVVGLGLGAVGGSAATWAVTHDDDTGTTADGIGRFDPDGGFGPPRGRGGMPPGGQLPDGQQQDGGGGTTGQLPGGGAGNGTDGSTGSDANGTSQTT